MTRVRLPPPPHERLCIYVECLRGYSPSAVGRRNISPPTTRVLESLMGKFAGGARRLPVKTFTLIGEAMDFRRLGDGR